MKSKNCSMNCFTHMKWNWCTELNMVHLRFSLDPTLICTVRSFYWADGYNVLVHTIKNNNIVWVKMMNRFIFDKSFDRLTCEWDLMLNYRVVTAKWFIFNITRYRGASLCWYHHTSTQVQTPQLLLRNCFVLFMTKLCFEIETQLGRSNQKYKLFPNELTSKYVKTCFWTKLLLVQLFMVIWLLSCSY